MENFVNNELAEKGRIGYLLSRTFPTYRAMKVLYPVLERRPILLPVFWTHRLTRAIIRKPRIVIYQLKGAFRHHGQGRGRKDRPHAPEAKPGGAQGTAGSIGGNVYHDGQGNGGTGTLKPSRLLRMPRPNPRQRLFFQAKQKYVIFGGARGGGKSWAVRWKAAQSGRGRRPAHAPRPSRCCTAF